uniref:ABC transporter domain-containing protein n=1 Tax=viral metagenome TaxID=1070528 RepID=A0A6C0B695_9ZZZZ
MELIETLLKKYLYEERWYIIIIAAFSLALNFFQVNGISLITANIIESIQKNKLDIAKMNYFYFIVVTVLFLFFYHGYKYYQNLLFTKLPNWLKRELVKFVIISNNENISSINFAKLTTPINRITNSIYGVFYRLLVHMFPDIVFLFVINFYFIYMSVPFGIVFFIANAFLLLYMFTGWSEAIENRKEYEEHTNMNEKFLIDLLNNIEKIIYRGKGADEINRYSNQSETSTEKAISFYKKVDERVLILNIILSITIFTLIGGLFYLFLKKLISIQTFIAFFTILLLYRDRMSGNYESLVDYIEFFGKLNYVADMFTELVGEYQETKDKEYKPIELNFDRIEFENISYKYPGTDTLVFDRFNIDLDTKDKIIGITGISGKGKSTLVKLLVKLYRPLDGSIYIDKVNINDIDPNYLRKNITYVNQNSKLFDIRIIDNILYGCNDHDACNGHLSEIIKYPKIKELYDKLDLHNGTVGSLGEKLSGGQRQITNIIGGLVNPSKILVLDEPTNALDPELKSEIIKLIVDFKKHKKCIIIITHDETVYPIFTEKITI